MNNPAHFKRNALLLIASMGAGAALIWWLGRPQSAASPSSPVLIKNGQTIDFSSGKPVVGDSTKDKAIIDAAVKEMDEAARQVTFSGSAATVPAEPKKKTEAPMAPPSQR